MTIRRDFITETYGTATDDGLRPVLFTLGVDDPHAIACDTAERFAELAERANAAGRNVYYSTYCISSNTALHGNSRGKKADVAALVALHADVDVKGEAHTQANLPPDMATARRIIDAHPIKPSIIIDTGHGLQALWLFNEPWTLESDEERAAAEMLVRRNVATLQSIARQMGGVHVDGTGDITRVLRLPGGTNRKMNKQTGEALTPQPVRVVFPEGYLNGNIRRYNAEDIEPYLVQLDAVAEVDLGTVGMFNIDASASAPEMLGQVAAKDKRLAALLKGDVSNLSDQSTSAARFAIINRLVRAGADDQAIADTVCHWYARHHPDYDKHLRAGLLAFEIAKARTAERARQAKFEAEQVVDNAEPIPLADHYLDQRCRDNAGNLLVRRYRGEYWRHRGSCYRPETDEAIDAQLYNHLDGLFIRKRDEAGEPLVNEDTGKPVLSKLVARSSVVREVRLAIPSREALLPDDVEAPCWLDGRTKPNPREVIAHQRGLLDLRTDEQMPHTPALFNHNALDFAYRADAPAPEAWLTFLGELFDEDLQAMDLLQDWFGYCLTPDTRQQKILLIVGPKRSGKGTVGRVLTGLLGQVNVAGPTLASLGTNFGLQPLIGKPLAIVADARLSGRTDQAVIAERLLNISGEDPVTIDRKYASAWTGRLPTRFMVLTNELPRLADASGALASRFLILNLSQSFYGREDHGLADRLLDELPGILLWAIEGWRRLQERGRFIQPESAVEAMQELEDLGSPIGAFIRDRCIVQPGRSIETKRLYEAWRTWCESEGRDHPGTAHTFGRDLRAAVSGIRTTQPRVGGLRLRFYEGIDLAD